MAPVAARRADSLSPPLTREALTAWPALVAAYHEARRGKRSRPAVDGWFHDWELRLHALREGLVAGWRFGPYTTFEVCDPRRRLIAAAPFEDRVVHHAMVTLLAPYFERGMIATSFACRTKLGGSASREALLRKCRSARAVWFVKCDVRRYFPSVRHDLLIEKLHRACGDDWSRALGSALGGSWPALDAPGHGLPIGNLTSQLFANVYLDTVDRFMRRTARARGYLRYVDDMVWFGDDLPTLHAQVELLRGRLTTLGLTLHPQKTRVGRVDDGVDFAGVVASRRWVRLRGRTKRRALRHLASLRRRWRAGEVTEGVYLQRLRSFVALGRAVGATRMLAKRGMAW